jgi:hypothetical protein
MITWLWITGIPAVLFAAGIGSLVCLLHREGATVAGMAAWWRMRRRPAMSSEEAER